MDTWPGLPGCGIVLHGGPRGSSGVPLGATHAAVSYLWAPAAQCPASAFLLHLPRMLRGGEGGGAAIRDGDGVFSLAPGESAP